MRWLILYLHLASSLFSSALVTEQRGGEPEAHSRRILLAVTMLSLALIGGWPIMLGVALGSYFRDSRTFR